MVGILSYWVSADFQGLSPVSFREDNARPSSYQELNPVGVDGMRWVNGQPLDLRNPQSLRIHVWYIYLHLPHKNQPNVGKYTIHGSYGKESCILILFLETLASHSFHSGIDKGAFCMFQVTHMPLRESNEGAGH